MLINVLKLKSLRKIVKETSENPGNEHNKINIGDMWYCDSYSQQQAHPWTIPFLEAKTKIIQTQKRELLIMIPKSFV